MSEFKNTIQVLNSVQNYCEFLKNILIQSEINPELLLTSEFLTYPLDREYVFAGLLSCFGEDGLEEFLQEYFSKIIKFLAVKIPIEGVVLKPQFYNDTYVLIGYINDDPRMIIDTFSKTIEYLQDDRLLDLMDAKNECIELIENLETQLNNLATNGKSFMTKKQTHQNRLASLVSQIGLEKQELSNINSAIDELEEENATSYDLAEKYSLRFKQFNYQIKKMEDAE